MSNLKLATAADVRTWAAKRGLVVGARGPLNQEIVAAFNKAHRAVQYGGTS